MKKLTKVPDDINFSHYLVLGARNKRCPFYTMVGGIVLTEVAGLHAKKVKKSPLAQDLRTHQLHVTVSIHPRTTTGMTTKKRESSKKRKVHIHSG